ncbi:MULTISPECIES: hypothetical protein [unclassified Gordonia (in: high G+C Gram-positive bacteria)]|uniref:hypothetical protein n=1 Tax=unclassified Gordonia (in: high G+C Gram-positive bacteria) TaxID=2657482 RepID=UPI0009AE0292|nr:MULTISPECIES: hypothetical protein [unclassified Gordonia (in: high G+C Gram-positive bacteria)]MDF3281738.1 hypothetical protein [Gordonia sp. N1V]OPX15498.1 hypothetical protein B1964_09575 [Gordonia sp. i37]
MCEQCVVSPVYFGEPLPGWTLARARLESPVADWRQGQWGLIRADDPTFVWWTTPTPSPTRGMSEDEEDAWWAERSGGHQDLAAQDPEVERELWATDERCADFLSAFRACSPNDGFDLVTAAAHCGYERARDGVFEIWFFDYLGDHLRSAPAEVDPYDERPELVRDLPFDATIGRHPLPGEPFYRQ